MNKVDCYLNVTAQIECPNRQCEGVFDLFEIEELTEEGYLYKELLSNEEGWGKENFGEIVKCPDCGNTFTVGDVIW